jgi:molybdenum cofactor cytidylyltransferase
VIATLILAGGESKRMGFPKLTLEYQGSSLLRHAIQKAKVVSTKVVVVVGAYAQTYRAEAEKAGARVVENPEWLEGLASSLRVGVQSLNHQAEAALILLPDQPFVPTEHLHLLIKRRQETKAQLVFSRYQGVLGAPCVISKSLFAEVQTLQGDKGAKALIREGVSVAEVELSESQDIDTPEDARQLKAES